MMQRSAGNAQYIDFSSSISVKRISLRQRLVPLVLALLAALIVVPTLTLTPGTTIAKADDSDKDKIKKAFDDEKDKQKDFDEIASTGATSKTEGFTYAFARQFTLGYMNYAPNATVGEDYKRYSNRSGDDVYNCDVNPKLRGAKGGAPIKGSLLYHNCDVPNLVTEYVQDFAAMFLPQGPKAAARQTARLGDPSWGLSWHTPKKVDPKGSGAQKYTGLEIYGYNFRFTRYHGEWDYIKVQTAARALSNFGFMDNLRLGVGTAMEGVFTGVGSFAGNVMNDLSSSDILGAITCVFRCGGQAVNDAGAAAVNRIIDTSDTNVFASVGWYRPDFGSTVYGVKELSEAELSMLMQSNFLDQIQEEYKNQKREETPDDLAGYEDYDSFPAKGPVCEATFTRADGADTSEYKWGGASGFTVPGVGTVSGAGATGEMTSEGVCTSKVNAAKPEPVPFTKVSQTKKLAPGAAGANTAVCEATWRPSKAPTAPEKKTTTTFTGATADEALAKCDAWDGAKPAPLKWNVKQTYKEAESVDAWAERTGWRDIAGSYDIGIEKEVTEGGKGFAGFSKSQRDLWIGAFIKLWEDKWWGEANARAIYDNQAKTNADWLENTMYGKDDSGSALLAKFFKDQRNPNSAMARFVCNKNIKSGDKLIFLFKEDGTLNPDPACPDVVRSPIQGALFGSGYTAEQTQPAADLRRELFKPSFWDITNLNPAEGIRSAGMSVAAFTTRVSNIFLNASFSPILETIGIKGIIVTMVEGFRDSIFYPLTVLMAMLAGVSIFINTLKNRAYLKGITDVGVLCLVFIFGALLLAKPDRTVDWVDRAPAWVETVIVGSIFEVGGGGDNLCSAGTVSQPPLRGFDGASLNYNPAAGTRTLLCENWRAFALQPYVYGQWGTGYGNLDDSKMKNTNEGLVGTAAVPLGGGVKERNWALFQMDTMTSGTTTNYDPTTPTGGLNKDFYRIVDMQAHPDMPGVGKSDPRYLEMWAGDKGTARMAVAILGAVISTLGMIVVVTFSFAKISISLVSTLLLLFLPLMLLIGLHPTQGRQKLKGYFARIVALMFQRVALVTMLALMMRIITELVNAADNFIYYSVISLAVCVFFLTHRKEILELFSKGITNKYGSFSGGPFDTPLRAVYNALPTSIQNGIQDRIAYTKGMTEDMAGGFMAGGLKGAQIARLRSKDPRAALIAQGVDISKLSEEELNRAIEWQQNGTQAHTARRRKEIQRMRQGQLGAFRNIADASDAGKGASMKSSMKAIEDYANETGAVDRSLRTQEGYDYDGKLKAFIEDLSASDIRKITAASASSEDLRVIYEEDLRTDEEKDAQIAQTVADAQAGRVTQWDPVNGKVPTDEESRAGYQERVKKAEAKAKEDKERALRAIRKRQLKGATVERRAEKIDAAIDRALGKAVDEVLRDQNRQIDEQEIREEIRVETKKTIDKILKSDSSGDSRDEGGER